MNIFDLRGPDFLFVYAVLTAVAVFVTALLRRVVDGAGVPLESPQRLVSDPYLIAQLRGGSVETLRVAAMSLIDRDLIEHRDGTMKTKKGVEPRHARRPIERDVLRVLTDGSDADALKKLEPSCEPYEERLRALKLIPDDAIQTRRTILFAVMYVLLGGVAATKIFIGLNRGKPVLFLVVFAVVSAIVLYKVATPRRTRHGDNLLADIQRLFVGLKTRANILQRGGATAELALLAAVFGMAAVPPTLFTYGSFLFPEPRPTSSSLSSSGCGSSSSSCGGSSCSSGCGGGGCGGCGGGD